MTKYSTMTKEEAAKLRTGEGKNYNGGKYDNPYVSEFPFGDAMKMFVVVGVFLALIVF